VLIKLTAFEEGDGVHVRIARTGMGECDPRRGWKTFAQSQYFWQSWRRQCCFARQISPAQLALDTLYCFHHIEQHDMTKLPSCQGNNATITGNNSTNIERVNSNV